MRRSIKRLAGGVALVGAAAAMLATTTPAAAHRFHGFHRFGFGFGFGYPVFYAPPIYPAYYPPQVGFIPPPLPPAVYHYGYRRVLVRHRYHRVVHHRWCSCSCCH